MIITLCFYFILVYIIKIMKNKKIIAWAIMLAALSTTSMASADFDCSSVDRETVKEIMDKKKSWETLTSTQEEILENMKECKPKK